MSERFDVLRMGYRRTPSYGSGYNLPERHERYVVDVVETFPNLDGAYQLRKELQELTQRLSMLGVTFENRYEFEVRQVKGGRSRIVDFTEHQTAEEDAYFGNTVEGLIGSLAIEKGK